MSLRRKTSVAIGLSLVLLTLIMYLGLRQVLVNNLLIQENENIREDMIRVINAFDNEKRELQGLLIGRSGMTRTITLAKAIIPLTGILMILSLLLPIILSSAIMLPTFFFIDSSTS